MVKNKCATPESVIKRGILLLNNNLPLDDEISVKLCLSTTSTLRKHHALRQSKMNKKRKYKQSDLSKNKRLIAKMTCLHKMGLIEKTKCHRSGKVPLNEDVKSWVGVSSCESSGYRKPTSCFTCIQVGHTWAQCVMPPVSKQSKAVFVLFDDDEMIDF